MIQYHNIPDFTFVNGTRLQNIRVAYRSINPESGNGVILIPTCFAGKISATYSFTQFPIDALAKYHVVIAAMLGNGESSSPSNTPGFPEPGQLHYEDVIHAHHHLLAQGLGVKQLQAVVGFSMGGQQAYHWSVMFPDFVKSIVGICTSARTSPHNYAFLEGPIAALENSFDYVAWKENKNKNKNKNKLNLEQTDDTPSPVKGLVAFGRAYAAWLTSAEWFRSQRWNEVGATSLDAWLKQSSEKNNAEWGADDLLVLARMWQMGDIGKLGAGRVNELGWNNDSESENDLERALTGINCPVLLMPNSSDQYFRPSENEFEMMYLRQGRLEVIESDWGHLSGAGICQADAVFMNSKLADFLTGL